MAKKKKVVAPRPYLSFTQLVLWERSPELYKRVYFYGEVLPDNEAMRYGREIHEALKEQRGIKDDDGFEVARMFIPSYAHREKELTARLGKITLFGRLDRYTPKSKIGDVKTGQKWTQAMTDNSDQITFYALIEYLIHKKIPALWIHWIETKELRATGRVENFKTKRGLGDLAKIVSRIKKAHRGIEEMTRTELKKIS